MVGYEITLGELEKGLDNGLLDSGPVYNTTVKPVTETKASRGWLWKLGVVLCAVALCAAAALIFEWNLHGRSTELQEKNEPQVAEPIVFKDPDSILKTIGNRAKAAIHLEGEYNPDIMKDEVQWKEDEGQAFSQGGFQLQGNRILIAHPGLYFVYSQASFRVNCRDPDHYSTPVSHIIWRYSKAIGDKASLLSGLRSVCHQNYGDAESNMEEGWYNSVYLGAVFELEKGDKLWTETNRLTDVEERQGKNFFGVFAL